MRQFDFDSPLLPSARASREISASRSEPAIVGFAAFSLLGAIAMSFYCRMGLEGPSTALKPAAETPVYNAAAVPLDDVHRPLGAALVNAAPQPSSDNLEAVVNDGRRTRLAHDERHAAAAQPVVHEGAPLYAFPEFDALQRAAALGSASAVAGSVASQSGSGNLEAPSAAFSSFAPVPEPNAWSFAGVFAAAVCAAERLRRRASHRA